MFISNSEYIIVCYSYHRGNIMY